MNAPIAVVIVRPEHVASLQNRLGNDPSVTIFSDDQSLTILADILARPPRVLAVDSTFAATARGATLVARLKAEPHLRRIHIRVLVDDQASAPLILSQPGGPAEQALLDTSRPLELAGTRRAARVPTGRRGVVVNGERGQLVDLSVTGAQVIVPTRLRPRQAVRLTFHDESTAIRCQGTVAWSVAMPAAAAVLYRVGVEFLSADTARIEALFSQLPPLDTAEE